MKIYKISQHINNDYDTFSDAVVCAKNEVQAKRIHPDKETFPDIWYDEIKKEFRTKYADSEETYLFECRYGSWTNDLSKIEVEYIGEADEGREEGVVCSSFHAG
jgi:hypothetical protein